MTKESFYEMGSSFHNYLLSHIHCHSGLSVLPWLPHLSMPIPLLPFVLPHCYFSPGNVLHSKAILICIQRLFPAVICIDEVYLTCTLNWPTSSFLCMYARAHATTEVPNVAQCSPRPWKGGQYFSLPFPPSLLLMLKHSSAGLFTGHCSTGVEGNGTLVG